MKFVLIGAAAVAAAAFITPALAQAVSSNPGYCAELYRTQIAKTGDRAIHTPTTGRTGWRCRRSITMHTVIMADRNTTIDVSCSEAWRAAEPCGPHLSSSCAGR